MHRLMIAVYGKRDARLQKRGLDAAVAAVEAVHGEGSVYRSHVIRPTKKELKSPRWPCPTCGAKTGEPCEHVGGGLR